MKKAIGMATIFLMMLGVFFVNANAAEYLGDSEWRDPKANWDPQKEQFVAERRGVVKSYRSDDGLYTYNEFPDGTIALSAYWGDGEVYNVPETVDGKKVTQFGGMFGCDSYDENGDPVSLWPLRTNVRVINIGSNIKVVNRLNFSSYDGDKLEEVNFSEGVEEIRGFGAVDMENIKEIVFPKSLKRIYGSALDMMGLRIKKIVFLGDPVLEMNSVSLGYVEEVYFYEDALNASPDAFVTWNDEGFAHPWGHVVIYHKPGAKGFEKFEALGYTVKTFTEGEGGERIVETQAESVTEPQSSVAQPKSKSVWKIAVPTAIGIVLIGCVLGVFLFKRKK